MTTDFRALCAELAEDVRYLSECLRDPENGVDPVCLSECEDDLHRARAALAQPSPEGELTDEELLHVWRFNFAKTDQTRFLDISRAAIAAALDAAGLAAKAVGDGHPLAGRDADNICNRGRAGAGVQLELPARLRQALVRESEACAAFVGAIHAALAQWRPEIDPR